MPVEIQGINDILLRFEELSGNNMRQAMGRACATVERAAIRKAPKGAGALRRSIESKVEESGDEVIGTVFSALEYAPYVEYGTGLFAERGGRTDVPWVYQDDNGDWHSTRGMHPHPFLRPALNENREEITRILREGMEE